MVSEVKSRPVQVRAGDIERSDPREPVQSRLTDRYETLVSLLGKVKHAADEKKFDRLEAAYKALVLVIKFLQADPRINQRGSQGPLFELCCALQDLSQGAKPPLFFEYKRDSDQGAPTHLSAAVGRAQIVLALEILLRADIEKHEAAKWLADKLHRSGIRANDKSVQHKQVLRWRAEKGGKSVSGFDRCYRTLEAAEVASRGWPADPSAARQRAAELIQALKKMGF